MPQKEKLRSIAILVEHYNPKVVICNYVVPYILGAQRPLQTISWRPEHSCEESDYYTHFTDEV